MSDDHDPDVQDWFNRSVEELPRQPFTLEVQTSVRHKELLLQLPRYATWLMVFAGLWLLLPDLIALLNTLAALPLLVIEAGGELWPALVLMVMGLAWLLVTQARAMGFLSRT